MNWLTRMERKMGKWYIPELMKYLCIAMLGVFILEYLPLPRSASALLIFDRDLIFRGQIWRLVTFMILPPTGSMFWILFSLYFYFFLGTGLERQWGSRKFNLYMLLGWLCNVAAGLLTGFATNSFLLTSVLLAFAVLYPETEFMLFFILPLKAKWLGVFTAVYLLYQLIVIPWFWKIGLLFSMVPFALFFGRDAYMQGKLWVRHIRYWITVHLRK